MEELINNAVNDELNIQAIKIFKRLSLQR